MMEDGTTPSRVTRSQTAAARENEAATANHQTGVENGSPPMGAQGGEPAELSVPESQADASETGPADADDQLPSADTFRQRSAGDKRSFLKRLTDITDSLKARSRGDYYTNKFGAFPIGGRGRAVRGHFSEPTALRIPGGLNLGSHRERGHSTAFPGLTGDRPFASAPPPQLADQPITDTPVAGPRNHVGGTNPTTQTNPDATEVIRDNQVATPVVNQVITAITPNLDTIPSYDEENREGWKSYIQKWEILMAPYRFDNEQLALALPGKLTGSAWQSYMKVIENNPNCAKDFKALKAELTSKFKPNNPMQERKLWDLRQGKKSLNDYFSEVATLGESLFPNMDKGEKDRLLASAFTAGLKNEYQRFVLLKGRVGLREALAEAKKLEFVDQAMGHKVSAIDSISEEPDKVAAVNTPSDPIEPLRKEIEGLAKLVSNQAERSRQQDFGNQNNNYRGRGNGRRGRGRRGGYQDYNQRNNYYQGQSNQQGRVDQQGYYNPQSQQGYYQRYNQGYNQYNQGQSQQQYRPNYPYQNQNNNYYGRGQARSGYPNTGNRNPNNNNGTNGQGYSGRSDQMPRNNPTNNDPCFRCHRRHPPNQCLAVDAYEEELSPDQYAFQLLNQPPNEEVIQTTRPQEDCNSVDIHTSTARTSTRGRKGAGRSMRTTDYVSLAMLCVFGLVGGANADDTSKPSFSAWQPMNPMICGTDYTDAPQLFKIKDSYDCMTNDTSNSTLMPQKDFEMEIYKKNMLQTTDTAYQCTKYTSNVTTQITFSGVKVTDRFTEDRPVTAKECAEMVEYRRCSYGNLEGGDGVYITKNPVNAEYKYCCTEHSYGAGQCSMIEASVYKRHGISEIESTAGDVSHCSYQTGSCKLRDGSVIIWSPSNKETCEYTPWFKVKGTLYQSHFVSDVRDLVLTFNEYGYRRYHDCENRTIARSDQGLMVRFITPPIKVTISEEMGTKYTIQSNHDNLPARIAVIQAALQALATSQTQLARQLFWNSYYYTCKNLAELLQIVSMLLSQHPSMSARYLLQRSNLTAKAGPGFLQIYPCTIIEPGHYELQPMPEGNCTNYLPIKFTEAGSEQLGYLDPQENVIHTTTYNVNCDMKTRVLVTLNGTLHQYHYNGSVNPTSSMGELPIPNINLGTQPIQINEIIFSRAHRLNWEGQNDYRSLNHLLGTLGRQSQVLRAMGITTSRYRTFDENVVESREELLGGAFFAFLTGGHIASLWELWTLLCDIAITLLVLGMITKAICIRCCIPRFTMRRLQGEVAEVVDTQIETIEETNVDSTADADPETTSQDSELTRQYIAQLAVFSDLVESAPPPYTPIYPRLPTGDGYDNLAMTQ